MQEPQFQLGDTINLAARLEKNCAPDKLLIDNRTRTAAQRVDDAFLTRLNLQQLIIPPADAKGQAFPIRAWAYREGLQPEHWTSRFRGVAAIS